MDRAPLSVVIADGGCAERTARALDSVLQQTVRPQEVLVVGDAPGGALATTAGLEVRRVRVEGSSPALARNVGLRAAAADFVAFLAGDDWYGPTKVERSLALLERLGALCVVSDAWLVDENRIERRQNQGSPVPLVLTEALLIRGTVGFCSTVVCRREAALAAGGFDEDGEVEAVDGLDLLLRLAQREPIAYLEEPLTFCRVADDGLDGSFRHLRGIDRLMAKTIARHAFEPYFQKLVARRRAGARLTVARELLRAGRPGEARELIAEARRLAPSWLACKLWFMTLFKRASA